MAVKAPFTPCWRVVSLIAVVALTIIGFFCYMYYQKLAAKRR